MTEALLKDREASLALVTQRCEELEMMASSNSLEVKEVQRRYKVIISQMKTDNEELQKKYLMMIEELKISYEKQKTKMVEAYLTKIEYYKAREPAIVKEE